MDFLPEITSLTTYTNVFRENPGFSYDTRAVDALRLYRRQDYDAHEAIEEQPFYVRVKHGKDKVYLRSDNFTWQVAMLAARDLIAFLRHPFFSDPILEEDARTLLQEVSSTDLHHTLNVVHTNTPLYLASSHFLTTVLVPLAECHLLSQTAPRDAVTKLHQALRAMNAKPMPFTRKTVVESAYVTDLYRRVLEPIAMRMWDENRTPDFNDMCRKVAAFAGFCLRHGSTNETTDKVFRVANLAAKLSPKDQDTIARSAIDHLCQMAYYKTATVTPPLAATTVPPGNAIAEASPPTTIRSASSKDTESVSLPGTRTASASSARASSSAFKETRRPKVSLAVLPA